VLKKKTVKLSLDVKKNLPENYELEEVKIEPSEIVVAGDQNSIDSFNDTLSIPIDLGEELGRFSQVKDVILSDKLFNVNDVNKVNITYVIKSSNKE